MLVQQCYEVCLNPILALWLSETQVHLCVCRDRKNYFVNGFGDITAHKTTD